MAGRRCRRRGLLYALAVLLALVVLPTGTPEDLFTTVVIIREIGLAGYALVALMVYLVYRAVRC